MQHFTRAAVAALTISLSAAIPLAAGAATTTAGPDHVYQLTTAETTTFGAGGINGRLHIIVRPDGIIEGTYLNEDAGQPKNVTGGVEPNGDAWLEIGNGPNARRIIGTFHNGELHGTVQAYNDANPIHFDAVAAR